ncbi:LysR family transcriptional regulator substrate-binding protein [Beijerinckia sp. L45]|uniref:LysR family transcriptional regulator substrate-binding protein n=1 Tax=Beijerinckia sp. L45 TaxID=1641855 RepID=UPI00131BE807|nr:LysR family transcriptional regulator substrate-binding protein [Beijerinckia sp. L45]
MCTREASQTLLPQLRLALLSTLAVPLVPALLKAMERQQISVKTMSFVRGTSRNHTHDLISREVDAAITSDGLYEHDSIERHELVQESFVLVLPRGTNLPCRDLRTLATKMPFLRYTSRTRSGQLIERHFRRLRLEIMPKYLFESPDDLVSAVAAGHGWSVVTPTQLAYSLSDPSTIEIWPFPKPGLSRTITLIARRGEIPNVAAQIANVCRQVLLKQVQPRIGAFMNDLPTAFCLAEEASQDEQLVDVI